MAESKDNHLVIPDKSVPSIFLSSSSSDKDFVSKLLSIISDAGRAIKQVDTSERLTEIRDDVKKAITKHDIFLLILSSHSFVPECHCRAEARHAHVESKKVIVLCIGELGSSETLYRLAQKEIKGYTVWINHNGSDDIKTCVPALSSAFEQDADHTMTHTRLLARTLEWEEHMNKPVLDSDNESDNDGGGGHFRAHSPGLDDDVSGGRGADHTTNNKVIQALLIKGDDLRRATMFLQECAGGRQPSATHGMVHFVVASEKATPKTTPSKSPDPSRSASGTAQFVFVETPEADDDEDDEHEHEEHEDYEEDDDGDRIGPHKTAASVMISFAKQDKDFVKKLFDGFEQNSRHIWADLEDGAIVSPRGSGGGGSLFSKRRQSGASSLSSHSSGGGGSSINDHAAKSNSFVGGSTGSGVGSSGGGGGGGGGGGLTDRRKGIAISDVFLCVLTQQWLASKACQTDLSNAAELNKRIVVLSLIDTSDKETQAHAHIPVLLQQAASIFFKNKDDDIKSNMVTLLKAIDNDVPHLRAHTTYLNGALSWHDNKREKDLLLRGDDLQLAKQWISRCATGKRPAATSLIIAFIAESEAQNGRVLGSIKRSLFGLFKIPSGSSSSSSSRPLI